MALFSSTTKKHHAAAKLEGTETPAKTVKAKKAPKSAPIQAPVTSSAVKPVKAGSLAKIDQVVPAAKPASIILSAHMTEKAGLQHEAQNIYTFKVADEATKGSIKKAVKAQYKVTPLKVNIVRIPNRPITYRGRMATQSGFKKALVFLKKGDKIEFAA
jgi:large subunit ribosomal protein L23